MSWLLDTLVWTAALLALVLVVRRPVARHFGPQAAYALWALPALRLVMPPIELPAWLAPAETTAAVPAEPATYLVINPDLAALPPVEAAQSFDWLVLVPAVWLAGAAVFLAWRFGAYFALRRSLLAHARPVGESGRVRLVETPEVASPLAFGVLDKVVALPPGFMALYDRRARDLALEHELAHHRGHDLAVNIAVQPLFALHWFNPLSWLGWRALRRDQEAACDARVMAARGQEERAAYATLIASFAAGPKVALAAPMACPVLGDKSIVHRLRSLKMTDISRRRRIAGRAVLGAAVLALPLTASISYAEVPAAPEAPLPPEAPPAPLAPDPEAAPPAPEAPNAPEPPEAAEPARFMVFRSRDGGDAKHESRHELREGQKLFVIEGKRLTEEEFEGHMEAKGKLLEERLEARLKNLPDFDPSRFRAIEIDAARFAALAPEVRMDCDADGKASDITSPDGKRVIRICQRQAMRSALGGLRSARNQIARNRDMSDAVRKDVLSSLDREIERIEREN